MPTPATVAAPQTGQAGAQAVNGQPMPPMPVVPFTRASLEHEEPFLDYTQSFTTSSVDVTGGPIDVPAYGYFRGIALTLECSGGTGTAAVYKEDAPYSAIQTLVVNDVNGAPIFGPISGYNLYLVNKYGGYDTEGRPSALPGYITPATDGDFGFQVYIPVEIGRRDALGSLPNMNASSTYKLKITQAASTDVYSTPPSGGSLTIRYKAQLVAWAPPAAQSAKGEVQAVQPPSLGTTQFWTESSMALNSGNQQPQVKRVGNLIRNLLLVFRNTSDGLRSSTNLPDPLSLYWDGRLVEQVPRARLQERMMRRYGYGASGLDTGVLVWDFTHDFDGKPGDELRDLWLPTTQSTRLEVHGSFGAAGTLTYLVNDVAPMGNVYLGL